MLLIQCVTVYRSCGQIMVFYCPRDLTTMNWVIMKIRACLRWSLLHDPVRVLVCLCVDSCMGVYILCLCVHAWHSRAEEQPYIKSGKTPPHI